MTDKVFWLKPIETELGQKQARLKEMSGSDTFCVIPWIHIATRPNGQMRLCCTANCSGVETGDYAIGIAKDKAGQPVDFGRSTLAEAFNGDFIRNVRQTILNGDVPSTCSKCFKEESTGMVSKRIWEGIQWADEGLDFQKLIADTTEDGTVPNVIRYLDLRLGHTCQLDCITCTPHDSSGSIARHKKMFPQIKSHYIKMQTTWEKDWVNHYWFQRPELWEEIDAQIPNITNLYFAGGEPLLIAEHKRFILKIIELGYAGQVSLRYNSNALTVDQEWIDIWSKFKKVLFAFSLDGIFERLEYIRHPTEWSQVEHALEMFEGSPDNIEVTFAIAVQLMNIKHMPDFIKWRATSKYTKPNIRVLEDGTKVSSILRRPHLIWIQTWYNLRALPKADKELARQGFNDLKQWLWDNHSQDPVFWQDWEQWEGILNWMDSEDQTNIIPYFNEYLSLIDLHHGTSFEQTFPELAHFKDYGMPTEGMPVKETFPREMLDD